MSEATIQLREGEHVATDVNVHQLKQRLRSARADLGVSQRKAAQMAGISKSVLEKYESRGNERIPNTRQLFRLARLYHVSLDYLLGLDRTKTTPRLLGRETT